MAVTKRPASLVAGKVLVGLTGGDPQTETERAKKFNWPVHIMHGTRSVLCLPRCHDEQVALPVPGHGPVGDLRRAFADEHLWRHVRPRLLLRPRARDAQRVSGAQAGDELTLESAATLNVKGPAWPCSLSGSSSQRHLRRAIDIVDGIGREIGAAQSCLKHREHPAGRPAGQLLVQQRATCVSQVLASAMTASRGRTGADGVADAR